jgi:hypothetical protein
MFITTFLREGITSSMGVLKLLIESVLTPWDFRSSNNFSSLIGFFLEASIILLLYWR